jgi:hypothetical protein
MLDFAPLLGNIILVHGGFEDDSECRGLLLRRNFVRPSNSWLLQGKTPEEMAKET